MKPKPRCGVSAIGLIRQSCGGGRVKGEWSYLDALTFRVWLQTLFLPNARAAALEGKLPARSQASEIVRRQYARDAAVPDAGRLLAIGQVRKFRKVDKDTYTQIGIGNSFNEVWKRLDVA